MAKKKNKGDEDEDKKKDEEGEEEEEKAGGEEAAIDSDALEESLDEAVPQDLDDEEDDLGALGFHKVDDSGEDPEEEAPDFDPMDN